jgi:hypothetical protein
MKFDGLVEKILKEQSVVSMDPDHFDYSDPYWQTQEGKAERADRDQRSNAMVQGQQQPAQPSPTPKSLEAGESTYASPPRPGETNQELGNLYKKVQDAASSGDRASYDQAGREYQQKYDEVYPRDFLSKVKNDLTGLFKDKPVTAQPSTPSSQQPSATSTNEPDEQALKAEYASRDKALQDPNLPNVMKQKYSGKTWDDIIKDPNATDVEKMYSSKKRDERNRSLSPVQRGAEAQGGTAGQQTPTASAQQLQPLADDASKRYEQWKQEFSKKYPGTDFSTTDQNIKKMVDEFKTSSTDPMILQRMGQDLQANIDRVTKYNDNLFKQPSSQPQQSNDPFQSKVDQSNRQTQLWQSYTGVQQVGAPTSPNASSTQPPQTSSQPAPATPPASSTQPTKTSTQPAPATPPASNTSYTQQYMEPNKPKTMPFKATKN